MRWRTFCTLIVDLAEALGTQTRRHARRAAGRRPAHAAGADHRAVLRRGARPAPRAPAVRRLRGPDRHRRRAARRLPGGRHPVGLACGRASRTTSRRRRTRRRRSRSCASSRASSASRSTPRSSRPPAADYERQVSLAVQSDPDVQAFVERLERAAEEEEEERARRTCPPATSSRASSSASCASAGRARRTEPARRGPVRRRYPAAVRSPGSSTCEARRSMSPCSSQPPGMRSMSP